MFLVGQLTKVELFRATCGLKMAEKCKFATIVLCCSVQVTIDNYFKPEHEKDFSFLALDFRCSCQFSSVDVLSICMLNGTSSTTSYEYKHRTIKGRGEIVKVGSSCWVRSILFPTHTSVCIAMLLPVYVLLFSLLFYIFYTFHTSPF